MTSINNSTSIVNSVNSSPTPLKSVPTKPVSQNGDIWWSNAIFFVGMHVLAVFGVMVLSPVKDLDQRTALMCFVSWQLAQFGTSRMILNVTRIVGLLDRSRSSEVQASDRKFRLHQLIVSFFFLRCSGITMGYHRLWSHKAYTASFALRCVLAGMGCLGFQGSIK